jgi:hypothetical protein
MRKIIAAVASITAIAALVVPSLASASVQRYQAQTATFTLTQPQYVNHQFGTVWTHKVTVDVNPCNNTFTGTGVVTGAGGERLPTEQFTGSFGANNSVSFSMTRPDSDYITTLVNGVSNGTTISHPTTSSPNGYVDSPDVIDMKVTAPVFTDTSDYKNHGDYVSSVGGGPDAAHSCIGMPVNSGK